MPDYVTKSQLEGIMAGFQDQFRDFVMHFNKGQGILIQRFESVDRRLDNVDSRLGTVEKRLDGIDMRLDTMEERNNQRFEDIDQRFAEVNGKLDLLM